MTNIALLTQNTNIQSSVKEVTDLLQAELLVVSSIAALQSRTIDLIFWFPQPQPQPFDERMYQQLIRICPHVIYLVPLQLQKANQRFSVSQDPSVPCICLKVPFVDPEDISDLITRRFKL